MVGRPYRIAGKWYRPAVDNNYDQTGTASWYGPNFHGRLTANGEIFDQFALSAAHPTLPLPSYVRVQNLSNGRSITVRVNDRGPFANNRLIDLSRRSAEVLGFINAGTARVRVTYIGQAPVDGDDTNYLVAQINVPDGPVPPQSPEARGRGTPSIISREAGGLLGAFASLFSYAGAQQGEAIISDAHAAAAAVALQTSELETWRAGIEATGLDVDIALGTFVQAALANEIARNFAFLGAVEQKRIQEQGISATSLTLSFLKPGVSVSDVANLGRELGLEHIAAYNQSQY